MKLIVGLGNPGKQYEQTRHNVGFLIVDRIANANQFGNTVTQFEGELRKGSVLNEPTMILKPMTYMNLSGKSVAAMARYYKIEPKDIVVIHDDVDLEPGRVRARAGGGHGGNNGVRNIIAELGTADFHRIKVGVGKPFPGNVSGWVLAKMSGEELTALEGDVFKEVMVRLRAAFLQDMKSNDS